MDFKTIREFHWLTKSVIGLTGLFAGLFLIAIIVAVLRPEDYQASNALGMMLLSLAGVLMYVFPVILIIILLSAAVTWIKTWIEKYLDQMLANQGTLAALKKETEKTGETISIITTGMERIEKKLENIEDLLKKVDEY
jgi:uncharacterized membrane protein